MAEAMTNSEIEDVLSSIRRLVAHEARRPAERLVLTAEHRVRQANPTDAPPAARAAAPERAPVILSEPAEAPRTGPDSDVSQAPAPVPDSAATPLIDRSQIEAQLRALEGALTGGVDAPLAPEASSAAATGNTDAPAPLEPVAPSAPASTAAAVTEADDGDVALIDEEDLQRLVARLVREELHGQLGEKITLQVRKLVRAEIARALDERNLMG